MNIRTLLSIAALSGLLVTQVQAITQAPQTEQPTLWARTKNFINSHKKAIAATTILAIIAVGVYQNATKIEEFLDNPETQKALKIVEFKTKATFYSWKRYLKPKFMSYNLTEKTHDLLQEQLYKGQAWGLENLPDFSSEI